MARCEVKRIIAAMRDLEYRLLPQVQWERIREFFKDQKAYIPPPSLGVASVALSDGELAAALILQLVAYLGPLHVAKGFENKVNYRHLKANIDDIYKNGRSPLIINGYIALPQSEQVAALAEATGMTRLECPAILVETFDDAAGGVLRAS